MRKRRRRPRGCPLMRMDQKILHFLWKWKVATPMILYQACGTEVKPTAFNRRLQKLQNNDVITAQWERVQHRWTWELTDSGISQLEEMLPESTKGGFRSASPNHDFMCVALTTYPWLNQVSEMPETFTDQELLQTPEEDWPEWVPRLIHRRPDVFVKRSNALESSAISLEVEIAVKNVSEYRRILSAYMHNRKVARVLWMYRNPWLLSQVEKAKREIGDTSERYHVFLAEEDFIKLGDFAPVVDERSVKVGELRDILRGNHREIYGETKGIGPVFQKSAIFTDRWKYLKISTP